MALIKLSEYQVNYYLNLYKSLCEESFYRKLIGLGILRYAENSKNPEIEFLDLSDSFFALSRKEGEEDYFVIAKTLRRAAHKLYRKLKGREPANHRFLNVVR